MNIQFKLILVGFICIALLVGVVGFIQQRVSAQIIQKTAVVEQLNDARTALVDPSVHNIGHLSALSERVYSLAFEYAVSGTLSGEIREVEEADEHDEGRGHAHVASRVVSDDVSLNILALHNEFHEDLEDLNAAAAAAAAAADGNPLVGEAIAHIAEELEAVQELHKPVDAVFEEHFPALTQMVEAGNHEEAKAYVVGTLKSDVVEMRTLLERLDSHMDEEQVATAAIVQSATQDAAAAAAAARILTVGIVAAILLTLGMGLFVSRAVAGRLRKLQAVAEAVAGGEVDKRAEVKGTDEISRVAAAFNSMADNLMQERKLPENILQSMKDPLFILDREGKIEQVNEEALRSLGYKGEELVGKALDTVFVGLESGEKKVIGK